MGYNPWGRKGLDMTELPALSVLRTAGSVVIFLTEA